MKTLFFALIVLFGQIAVPQRQPVDRAPEMMQRLLAERFKLSIHRENREQSVYALVVGRGGLKIKEAAAVEAPPATGGLENVDDRLYRSGYIFLPQFNHTDCAQNSRRAQEGRPPLALQV